MHVDDDRPRPLSTPARLAGAVVLLLGALGAGAASLPGRAAGTRLDTRVDINRADAGELSLLPSVGPVIAGRIVEYRDAHGPFLNAGELVHVRGIGGRTVRRLSEHVRTE